MPITHFDIRQSITRVLQDQLNAASNITMDSTLASINNELTFPGRLIAASTPSLVVTVGNGTVTNPNTSKKRVLPLIKNVAVSFPGGTLTFPSGTGTITVSPGTNASITIGASQFVAVLVQLDSSGNLNLVVGVAAGSLGAVVVPGGAPSFLSLGYIIVQSNGSSVIQPVTNSMIYQFSGSGGTGSSSTGNGTGDDLDALQYNASFTDTFVDPLASSLSSVDSTAAHTNAVYSATNDSFAILYDASRTVTGAGTAMTLSGTPSYTVVAGDMLRVGTEARRITVVTTQTSYTVESAFTVDPVAAAATVSQAVYTKDINNFVGDGISIASMYDGNISDCIVTYNDTTTGMVYNPTDPPLVGFTASSDGTLYSPVGAREANLSLSQAITGLPTTGSNLYIRFFSNKTSGTGTVNLVGYKAFFHRSTATESGGIQLQAICFTNSVGTPVGCSNPTVVGGKTRITLVGQTYPVNVNSGKANGGLIVTLNGQKIPRFIDATLTPDASYTEVNANTIDLDQNYSALNYSVEIYQYTAVVDSNTQNTTNIATLNTHLFRNYVINGNFDFWQRGTSFTTPASSTLTADRWLHEYDGTIGTFTISRQTFTLGQTDVPNEPVAYYRWNQTVAGSGQTENLVGHVIENVRTLAGKDVTLTFWAKADSARTVGVALNQGFGTGGGPSADVTTAIQNVNLTTVWQKFPLTFNLPSIAGKTIGTGAVNNGVAIIFFLPVNTTKTIDFAQVMLNEGTVAAPWVYASGGAHICSVGAELALCQRYYEKSYDRGVDPGSTNLAGSEAYSPGSQVTVFEGARFKVSKCYDPTVTGYSPATGTSGQVRNVTDATDVAVTFPVIGQSGARVTWTNVVGKDWALHWTAESEI